MRNRDGMDGPPERAAEPSRVFFSREALSGLPWMVLAKGVLFFVYIGISVVLVRGLGPDRYGLFSLCKSLGEYLVAVCCFGLNSALLRFIPELVRTRNKAGLRRLLWKTAVVQGVLVLAAIALLQALEPFLSRWFRVEFRHYLLFTGLLVGAQVAKEYLNDSLTALFQTWRVSLFSVLQGFLWLGLLWFGLRRRPGVDTALAAHAASILLVSTIAGLRLARFVTGLRWRSPPYGIGKRRTLKLSGAILVGSLARMLMLKYTEVFFLGLYYTTGIVGAYDLGYSLPQMVVGFLPAAIQTLFVAAFADAYVRDPGCLDRLVGAYYRMLLLLSVPVSAFGLFFAPRAILLIYGEEMAAAGPVASAFCIVHLFPLVSVPLSMAITTREKNLTMLPLLLVQVAVNLLLDWTLIPRWGMAGGVAAVAGTFLLTIPFRLGAVSRIVGGIHFPTSFCVRVVLACFAPAAGLWLLVPRPNLLALTGLACLYFLLCLGLIRGLRLVREDDVADFRTLRIAKLDRGLALLTGRRV